MKAFLFTFVAFLACVAASSDRFGRAPASARARQNPFPNDGETIAAGAKLYGIHCAECHGGKAQGARRGPSLRTRAIDEASPGTLFWILTNGNVRHGMPSWSKLPEAQRWQLVTWLKSSQK